MKLPVGYVAGVGVHQATAYGGFGQKMLERMGWEDGQGLGKEKSGITKAITVKKKEDTLGVSTLRTLSEKVSVYIYTLMTGERYSRQAPRCPLLGKPCYSALASRQLPPRLHTYAAATPRHKKPSGGLPACGHNGPLAPHSTTACRPGYMHNRARMHPAPQGCTPLQPLNPGHPTACRWGCSRAGTGT